jgi:heme/copper-type cytochrome/quinol oxidase subunit 4
MTVLAFWIMIVHDFTTVVKRSSVAIIMIVYISFPLNLFLLNNLFSEQRKGGDHDFTTVAHALVNWPSSTGLLSTG